jgi:hypothetical protein
MLPMMQVICEQVNPAFEAAINKYVGITKAVTAGIPPIRIINVDTDKDDGWVKALASHYEVETSIEYFN